MFNTAAKFVTALIVTTIGCTIIWQEFVNEGLYDYTDAFGFDYLQPGNWVHNLPDNPVATVHQVIHHRPMSEPDTIKEGWTVTRLWHLWFAFLTVSIVVSALLSRLSWTPGRWTERNSP
jgi:hypothetical protein